ncbi:DNA-binding response OmpR family regulator [Thiogranum longum]|uniref:Phosphate regulon transcriptional regulatory protein PhoB n=1 Tax=Thiogranum longum TaxID=1537524 RepID=A0A4R1HBW5_9GAMM|nr:response regulator transcription factor [Thiogranum longum]TCK18908.1 DNA-binding response OmpR family regulator [Thiogranum longum]
MAYRLLIVEDNADIAQLIQFHVRDLGCDADIAGDGNTALELFRENSYQLVVLDLMLPGLDGLEVCRQLRVHSSRVPILMLTSRSAEQDRVAGLETGADDYITKPFSFPELMARIKAQFRRMEAHGKQDNGRTMPVNAGDILIDTARRQVKVSGKEVVLTAREFDLLLHFASHPGQVFSRTQLLEKVWGYHYEGYEHTVNSHINRLRSKIEKNPAEPHYILTVWGVGYRFNEVLN